jgi:hypothetical protein
MRHRLRVHVTCAKVSARNRRAAAEIPIMHREIHIRESRTGPQRSKAAVESAIPRVSKTAAPTSPPRMEKITRPERQPTESAAETETHTKSEK